MRIFRVLAAACSVAVAVAELGLSIEGVNPLVVRAEYAVRGRLLDKAVELERDLKAGKPMPFSRIVRCNIGNPQALGQKPLTFVRQTLSLVVNPALLEEPAVLSLYPEDVTARAKAFLSAVPSAGAYSDSQGIALVRQHVAEFISARDGGSAADPDDVFLTDGASAGVKALMTLMIRGPLDAVLVPVPQYPLYSATTTMLNGTLAPYYLDEDSAWGVTEAELQRSLDAVGVAHGPTGAKARAIVVINPGNPTGQSLPQSAVEAILKFAAANGLVVMADEVYQENVYGGAPRFTSFKRALVELQTTDPELAAKAQLVSFHSTSKGFIGECGLRGGYFELQNIPLDVRAQLTKLASVSLCSNVIGQFATGLMVKPPLPGQPSFEAYQQERESTLSSLESRALHVAKALNALPGVTCNKAEGAMYLFPQVHLPSGAVAAAGEAGMAADEFYCIKLLEATGLVVVPGSGFNQVEGTFHFRTTFLPPEDMLKDVLPKLEAFQKQFMASYGGGDGGEL